MYFISSIRNNERSINNISNDMIDNDNDRYFIHESEVL